MAKTVEQYLKEVDYTWKNYKPSKDALRFVNFIKAVNGGSEENKTPIMHLALLDNIFTGAKRNAVMIFRGAGKTTLLAEYLILYIAAFGKMPGFGEVDVMMYVTDSVENGVKNLRKNVEFRYNNSDFLKEIIPNRKFTLGDGSGRVKLNDYEEAMLGGRKFTDIELAFENIEGKKLIVKGYGALTGIRGSKVLGKRPQLAVLDDLLSDTDANSKTIIRNIEDTIYKAVSKALDPNRQKMIYIGTPFNKNDPLYKAVESGAWKASVFPVCEKFPVEKHEFRSAWEDRFNYGYVKDEYDTAMSVGRPDGFFQEMMLDISSGEDKLVPENSMQWFSVKSLGKYLDGFNLYMTTDLTASNSMNDNGDRSVIMLWAVNNNHDWFLIDLVCRVNTIEGQFLDLINMVQRWQHRTGKFITVGIETDGQQRANIYAIQELQRKHNIYFSFAKQIGADYGSIGVSRRRAGGDKLQNFMRVQHRFVNRQIFFPEEYKETPDLKETIEEITMVTAQGIKSKHDDAIDAISMIELIDVVYPSVDSIVSNRNDDWYADDYQNQNEDAGWSSYL